MSSWRISVSCCLLWLGAPYGCGHRTVPARDLLVAVPDTSVGNAEHAEDMSLEETAKKVIDENSPQLIKIDRRNIGRRYLWSGWFEKSDGSVSGNFSTGYPFFSKVVYFDLSEDCSTVHFWKDGTSSMGQPNDLIDRFPVRSHDADFVIFDFSRGLSSRKVTDLFDEETLKLDFVYSFIHDVEARDGVTTFVELLRLGGDSGATLSLRHAFRPLPDVSGFRGLEVRDPLTQGFFPVSMAAGQSKTHSVLVRRWNNEEPIRLFLSVEVPVEYREFIRAGVLWWNEALESELIRVEQLDESVDWADARINILQWSDDSAFCGGAAAFGPTEVNPRTGEILSGKVLYCGRVFERIFTASLMNGEDARTSDLQRLHRWAAAHEVGHILGFSHNFRGKLRGPDGDTSRPGSTVMDYLYPTEAILFDSVGERDRALVRFLYSEADRSSAKMDLDRLETCIDAEVIWHPYCNHFVRGGLSPILLTENYIEGLVMGGNNLSRLEHVYVPKVAAKLLVGEPSEPIEMLLDALLAHWRTEPDKFGAFFQHIAAAGLANPDFRSLPVEKRERAYAWMVKWLVEFPGLTEDKEIMLFFRVKRDELAWNALKELHRCFGQIAYSSSSADVRSLYRLAMARVKRHLNEYWQ